MAQRSFYRAANAILSKIGGRATEDVILQLIRSKCLPALLYGLEACHLRKADSKAAFTPAQHVARNKQLVAGNKQLVARNMLLVRAICCRATCCAGVNAA